MVPIAVALRDAGHDVTWATAPDGIARVEPLGFRCHPAGMDTRTRMQRQMASVPGLQELPLRERRPRLAPMFSGLAAPAMFEDLRPIVDDLRPDLVVSEPLELAAPVVATAAGLPHATVGFGGLFADWVFDLMQPDLEVLWNGAGLEAPRAGGIYEHAYLHSFPASLGQVPADRNIAPIRPQNFDGDEGVPAPEWIADVGRDRPAIYVTFGTEFGAFAPFGTVAEGVADVDADVVMTVGATLDPTDLGPFPSNVRAECYVPQRLLLERVSLLISHAGSGATLGAATVGLPHVAIPLGADQFDNAAALEAAGAGVALDVEALTPDVVRAATERLLTDPGFGVASARLAAEIATMPEPSTHVPGLEGLAARR
jgi:UDP:flavonoid glycosyltransferase YjiC (YdhE family)